MPSSRSNSMGSTAPSDEANRQRSLVDAPFISKALPSMLLLCFASLCSLAVSSQRGSLSIAHPNSPHRASFHSLRPTHPSSIDQTSSSSNHSKSEQCHVSLHVHSTSRSSLIDWSSVGLVHSLSLEDGVWSVDKSVENHCDESDLVGEMCV